VVNGESYIMRSFIICTANQILLACYIKMDCMGWHEAGREMGEGHREFGGEM
jgi:hypothetical protein